MICARQGNPLRAAAAGGAHHRHRSVDARGAVAFRNYRHNGSDRGVGGNGMPDELTDYQIALLCDIQEGDLTKFAGDRKRDLERLLSEGYVEPTQSHPGSAFKLTAKGAEFLGLRGAGLNEA
jgi:hypothetical protein